MKSTSLRLSYVSLVIACLCGCGGEKDITPNAPAPAPNAPTPNAPAPNADLQKQAGYTGTGSVSQGLATTTATNLYTCERGRVTNMGTIDSFDGKQWVVPAENHFQDKNFPFAADLYNPCNGNTFPDAQTALSKLDGSDVIEVDPDGEQLTAYIFGDNYFEMYINGVPVGKDRVPFTQFNSSLIRFRVNRPFTVAMKLIDWEEHLGVGCEANRGVAFHAGDGGMVAVIKDEQNRTIATTDDQWKAQTFYTAPIKDLKCAEEVASLRRSGDCDQGGGQDGSSYYALHWALPKDWMSSGFDDSTWPNATTYANKTIGVDNKRAYTNFTDLFDDPDQDAQFIWSSNVVLDNEVIVRFTVKRQVSKTTVDPSVPASSDDQAIAALQAVFGAFPELATRHDDTFFISIQPGSLTTR